MYIYDQRDHTLLGERVDQFKRQTKRFLSGELTEEEFLPLRLQNGLYVQRLAPMLRIAVPYGMLSSLQVRKLAHITRHYDKGYCHVTTRQNIQLNWPRLEDVPEILEELASVSMHAIQTSGNCIRNVTSDAFAGVADDEVADPRPYCELVRQWSTLHPEFAFLPRKFKIAINGTQQDRVAMKFHDIGLQIVDHEQQGLGFEVYVGGGMGRTPVIGQQVRDFLPQQYLLSYLCAIVRTYNRLGRRDNKYKARIKILVKAMGVEKFRTLVEEEWLKIKDSYALLSTDDVEKARSYFTEPKSIKDAASQSESVKPQTSNEDMEVLNPAFSQWLTRNVRAHRNPTYAAVTLSLKPTGVAPGDITADQLDILADLAERYSQGELRTTHEQNVVLADVSRDQLFSLWIEARGAGFATPNIETLTDIVCCPGGDFCALANAKSLPIAESIQKTFDDMDYVYDLGELSLNISGCMNACAHHHVSDIGILGVDKKGEEFYQVMLGGDDGRRKAAIGKVLGPASAREAIPRVVQRILDVFLEHRIANESFAEVYQRIGLSYFKERVYG
ncbi:MAG: sulfite reductase [Cellvibrionaceae bacterium]|mgnify:CR=1 FL=1|nr:sulfite reductase [Cellvibrionaceae bacterium]|tara:strand:- start:27316 stop:28989 length:1674 start_codon:yes stop_codon:yes gene_type:complete